MRRVRLAKELDGWLVQIQESPRRRLVQLVLQSGTQFFGQQGLQRLQNNENLAMGKVEDDRWCGFVLEVLFKRENTFEDPDGCGGRTIEGVMYRATRWREVWKRCGRNTHLKMELICKKRLIITTITTRRRRMVPGTRIIEI
jgi:hypothetical protein